jgi:hypothetical protein
VTGLKVKRLRKHRAMGLAPEYVKIGRSVYYKLSSLFDYVSGLPTGGNGAPVVSLKKRCASSAELPSATAN